MKRKSLLGIALNQLVYNRALSLFIVLFFICLLMAIRYPTQFATFDNINGILLNMSFEAICAVGMMFLIVSGVFDLSIGANLTLAGAITAMILRLNLSGPIFGAYPIFAVALAIVAGIAVSSLAGLANGFLVAKIGVNALISTLAMMFILRGIAIIIAGSGLVIDQYESFVKIGQMKIFGLQLPIYFMVFFVLLGHFLLSKTRFFRQFYFIGGNKKSAELSGIKVQKAQIINFLIMGFLSGVAGIVFAARLNKGSGIYAETMNLDVIAAVIIGGGSLLGGKGNIAGAFMGVLFIHIIKNIMIIMGISPYIQPIVNGIILIIAVALDVLVQKRYIDRGHLVSFTRQAME